MLAGERDRCVVQVTLTLLAGSAGAATVLSMTKYAAPGVRSLVEKALATLPDLLTGQESGSEPDNTSDTATEETSIGVTKTIAGVVALRQLPGSL
jgi:hypothetical protein